VAHRYPFIYRYYLLLIYSKFGREAGVSGGNTGHIEIPSTAFKEWYRTITITPWSRGLLEKLTVSQLVKKFPALYENRWFITAFTTARHLSLS
jgi:hypothetical protein